MKLTKFKIMAKKKQAPLLEFVEDLELNQGLKFKGRPIFRTHYNGYYFQKDGEIHTEPSMCIPDQTFSIREILQRFTQGIPIPELETPTYYGEDDEMDGIDINTLDMAERQEVYEKIRQEVKDLKAAAKLQEKPKMESKPNQGSTVLETLPTEAKSGDTAKPGPL